MKKIIAVCVGLYLGCSAMNSYAAATVGAPAPAFSLPNLQSQQPTALSQFAGKVIYLDFWASWCAPCRTSFPLLESLYKKHGANGFEVVAINLDEESGDAQRFLKDYPVSFTILRDADGQWANTYGVESMPTSFIIDKKGVVQLIHNGFAKADVEELEAKIVELLK